MADFSHRPGWWLAPDGTWHPPQQRPDQSLGPPGARRGDPLVSAPAESEYRVWRILRDGLADGEMVFSDRRPAVDAGTIDHVVVASSGVWVVDAKRRRAVSYRGTGPTRAVMRLFCDKRDITFQLDQVATCADLVAHLVRDPSVPVRPAMTILPDQCSLVTGLHLRLGKTITHETVLICTPRLLVEQIRQPGPLSHDQVVHVGHRLDEALVAR